MTTILCYLSEPDSARLDLGDAVQIETNPKPNIACTTKISNLIYKFDLLRGDYNRQLEALKDRYGPKFAEVITELKKLGVTKFY